MEAHDHLALLSPGPHRPLGVNPVEPPGARASAGASRQASCLRERWLRLAFPAPDPKQPQSWWQKALGPAAHRKSLPGFPRPGFASPPVCAGWDRLPGCGGLARCPPCGPTPTAVSGGAPAFTKYVMRELIQRKKLLHKLRGRKINPSPELDD